MYVKISINCKIQGISECETISSTMLCSSDRLGEGYCRQYQLYFCWTGTQSILLLLTTWYMSP